MQGSLVRRIRDGFAVMLGQRLPLYREGRNTPSLFSSEDRNREVQTLNALTNPELRPKWAGNYFLSDSNSGLDIQPLIDWINSLPSDSGGSVNVRGQWNNTTDYAVGDIVWVPYQVTTQPNNRTRILYVALTASGPSNGGAQAPQFPEPTTTYWQCLVMPTPTLEMVITAVANANLTCSDTLGNTGIVVAYPNRIATGTVNGVAGGVQWDYSGWTYVDGSQTRIATIHGTAYTMTQVVTAPYHVGDTITVEMVYNAGSPYFTWRDKNENGRNWGKVYGT